MTLCAALFALLPEELSLYRGEEAQALWHTLYTIEPTDDGSAVSGSHYASAYGSEQYTAKLKILGFLPIKTVTVDVIEKQTLYLGGGSFGIKLYTDGVIVVGTGNFLYGGKTVNPAYEAGIRTGDRLISVDGTELSSNEQLAEILQASEGSPLHFIVIRKNLKFEATVTPIIPDGDGKHRIGLWVRDSTAGIGTMTYYNQSTGNIAGLGHSVADIDTGELMPASAGSLVAAKITDIEKGSEGHTGELSGVFATQEYGSILANTESGIFAKCGTEIFERENAIEIALKGEITEGAAQIRTTLDESGPKFYDIEIVKINNNLKQNKNMVVRITDPELLEKTGGIVQGMSGSPIIQNGKLVGALTHVFVNEPTEGYGIFIEKMLMEENSLSAVRNPEP